jgi:hypothetical protein
MKTLAQLISEASCKKPLNEGRTIVYKGVKITIAPRFDKLASMRKSYGFDFDITKLPVEISPKSGSSIKYQVYDNLGTVPTSLLPKLTWAMYGTVNGRSALRFEI